MKGPCRTILVDLSMNVILEASRYQLWSEQCLSCSVNGIHVLQKLLFVTGNCWLANKV